MAKKSKVKKSLIGTAFSKTTKAVKTAVKIGATGYVAERVLESAYESFTGNDVSWNMFKNKEGPCIEVKSQNGELVRTEQTEARQESLAREEAWKSMFVDISNPQNGNGGSEYSGG